MQLQFIIIYGDIDFQKLNQVLVPILLAYSNTYYLYKTSQVYIITWPNQGEICYIITTYTQHNGHIKKAQMS